MIRMKKIIPFNNVLQFNTDVKEITAISLEHEIKKYPDTISGTFFISGEYKMAEGLLDKEKFNFELPFDIALSQNYKLDSLVVDIDDFRYDLVADRSLKVNIDLYIDGEVEEPLPRSQEQAMPTQMDLTEELLSTMESDKSERMTSMDGLEESKEKATSELAKEDREEKVSQEEAPVATQKEETTNELETAPTDDDAEKTDTTMPTNKEVERIDLLKDMLTNDKETAGNGININNININALEANEEESTSNDSGFTIPSQEEEKYVTYRVYKVTESDTIDSILAKYNVTKEMLSDYNNLENITAGDKLIIPTNEE